jgi:cell division protein ZipA
MQKELQITLTIIGILVIGGVLLHGMWTTRKNSEKLKKARFEPRNWDGNCDPQSEINDDELGFDDVGVSKARVVTKSATDKSLEPSAPNKKSSESFSNYVKDECNQLSSHGVINAENAKSDYSEASNKTSETAKQSQPPVYSNVVTQRKPEFSRATINISEESFGQPPVSLLNTANTQKVMPQESEDMLPVDVSRADKQAAEHKQAPEHKQERVYKSHTNEQLTDNVVPHTASTEQATPSFVAQRSPAQSSPPAKVENQLSFTEQAKRFVRRNKKTVAERIRREPVLKSKEANDQMRIEFNESQSSTASQAQSKGTDAKLMTQNTETDVLVLNIRATDGKPIIGASLLPMLLTLGFKFGEHDIFHRHVNTNGKGPILFSLTNMFNPGVFDIDNIENFSTYGLSLFMMLPIEGEPQQVFNMMHNATRKISDEFGCRLLDGNKVGLSKQSLQQYVERIREFERRRISQN